MEYGACNSPNEYQRASDAERPAATHVLGDHARYPPKRLLGSERFLFLHAANLQWGWKFPSMSPVSGLPCLVCKVKVRHTITGWRAEQARTRRRETCPTRVSVQ